MRGELIDLAARYRAAHADAPKTAEGLRALYARTVERKQRSLLDAVAAAAAIGPFAVADQIDYAAISPQMREAFELAFPNTPFESLAEMKGSAIAGFVSGWKGKYFEILVRDRLNAGLPVGDLQLEAGQEAVLAATPTQPGWDLAIVDEHGQVVDLVQLKATTSLAYLKEALEKYPDIHVLATDEAVRDHVGGMVHDTGFSTEDLDRAIEAPLEDLLDGPFEELVENVLPMLPFVIIAVGEGRHVIAGRKEFRDAVLDGGIRGAKTGAAMGVGAFVVAVDGGWLSIPATLLTRLGIERGHALYRAGRAVERRLDQAIALRADYVRNGLTR